MEVVLSGELRLGHLFQAAGLAPEDVIVIRHMLNPDGLKTRADAAGPNLLAYVREQGRRNSKLPATPPRIWLNFLATAGQRARFVTAFENGTHRPSALLRSAPLTGVVGAGGPAGH